MSDPVLDYEQMFKNLKSVVDKKMEEEEEYFFLHRRIKELSPYADMAAKRIMELKMKDQIIILKCAVMLDEASKRICEKYGWDDEIDIVEME